LQWVIGGRLTPHITASLSSTVDLVNYETPNNDQASWS